MNTNKNNTIIHICTHHELVAPHLPLGRRRLEAVRAAGEAAKDVLETWGYSADLSDDFRGWYDGRFRNLYARPHNYFALPHADITDGAVEAIRAAAKVFFDTLQKFEATEQGDG